jgi:hypothetical protein
MVTWANEDVTTIEWADDQISACPSLAGGKAIRVSAPLVGHAVYLATGAVGRLDFDHPTAYSADARIRELTKNHGSFGATLTAIIEFE